MSKPEKPLRELGEKELLSFVGLTVQKVSGKPFSNREKFAEVIGVIRSPYTGRLAFTFKDAKHCEARQCILAKQS